MVTLVVGAVSVSAQATTKTLSTNYTVQNLGDDTANVEVSYTKVGGDAWTAAPGNTNFQVEAGKSKVVAQYLDDTLEDGAGSATVSSDQPMAAIVNMLARGQTPTSGSYTAFGEGSQSFYAPFAFKNLVTSVGTISSQLIVMNVGDEATDVDVVLVDGVTYQAVYTKTITDLSSGESFYYDQAEEDDANLPDGWFGSAQVSAASGGSIAVVGNQFTGDHGLLTYPGFSEGYTEWAVPLYLSRLANGYNSVIAIQNVSGSEMSAGDISVAFTPDASLSGDAGTPFTITLDAALPNNATWSVNPRDNDDFPVGSFGAAKITASGNIVAIVNQLLNEPPILEDSALSYNAIPTNLTGTNVEVPLVMSRLPNAYSTVMTVANLTDDAGTCDIYYKGDSGYGSGDVDVPGVTLPAGGSIVHNHRLDSPDTHNLPADWYGAVTVECDQPVAATVNQLDGDATSGDADLSYNAFTTD
jgi:hypothetical protein